MEQRSPRNQLKLLTYRRSQIKPNKLQNKTLPNIFGEKEVTFSAHSVTTQKKEVSPSEGGAKPEVVEKVGSSAEGGGKQ